MIKHVPINLVSTSLTFSSFCPNDKNRQIRSYYDACPISATDLNPGSNSSNVEFSKIDDAIDKIVQHVIALPFGHYFGFKTCLNSGKRSAKQSRLVYFAMAAEDLLSPIEWKTLAMGDKATVESADNSFEGSSDEEREAFQRGAETAKAFLILQKDMAGRPCLVVPIQENDYVVSWPSGEFYFPQKPESTLSARSEAALVPQD